MAYSSSNWFGNGSVVGIPQTDSEFNKFAIDASPKHAVGFKVEDAEGNVYRYSHFGAAVAVGTVVGQDVSETCLGDSDNVITTGTIYTKDVVITAGGPSGSPIAAGQFAGGKLITTDDTGEGYTYDIVSNTANSTVAGTITVSLRQPIQVAMSTDTDFIIVGGKYQNLDEADSTDSVLAGVACAANTSGTWGWVQTKGIVGIKCLDTSTVGATAVLTATAGSVGDISSAANVITAPIVGTCVVAGDSTGYGAYRINLD